MSRIRLKIYARVTGIVILKDQVWWGKRRVQKPGILDARAYAGGTIQKANYNAKDLTMRRKNTVGTRITCFSEDVILGAFKSKYGWQLMLLSYKRENQQAKNKMYSTWMLLCLKINKGLVERGQWFPASGPNKCPNLDQTLSRQE